MKGAELKVNEAFLYIFTNNLCKKFLCTNQDLCEFTGSSVKNYLCGINFLTIGDSLSAIYFFIEALKKQPNKDIKSRIENLIESQRVYLKEDLSKFN